MLQHLQAFAKTILDKVCVVSGGRAKNLNNNTTVNYQQQKMIINAYW